MYKKAIQSAGEKMDKTIAIIEKDLSTLRAGRANPQILDKITVDYYGTPTQLNQVGNISSPEPRMLVIAPWEPKMIAEIEKAIQKSDLGINPSNDGKVIRLVVPELNEERRKELCKQVKKQVEEGKVAIRNTRRDTMDQIKKMKKDSVITEDDLKLAETEMQKVTDAHIKTLDKVGAGQGKGDHVDLMLQKLTTLLRGKPRSANVAPRDDGARLALPAKLPRHVGIIMDGNGRWAQSRGLPRSAGHAAGTEALRDIIQACDDWGIYALSIYAFSTENWARPMDEVGALMGLILRYFQSEIDELDEKGCGHSHHRRCGRPAGQAARGRFARHGGGQRTTTACASTSP